MTERRLVQSPFKFCLHFPNTLHRLFTKRIREINPEDLGGVPSGELASRGKDSLAFRGTFIVSGLKTIAGGQSYTAAAIKKEKW